MPDPNRFLHGPFAPVEEEITAFDLPVTGALPAGLNGRYLRNGPNPLGLEDPGYRFWEDGGRAWCTGCGCATARPSGTATAGSAPRYWPRRRMRNGPPGRSTTTWTSPPTPTSSPMPGVTWPPSRPARCPMSCPASWTPSARATFPAHCPAASPPTPRLDRRTGELHAIAYFWAWGLRPARRHRRAGGTVSRTTDIAVAEAR